MQFHRIVPIIALSFGLAACGGGGGSDRAVGGGIITPPPPPPPPVIDYDTAEYRESWGLDAINAIDAYDDGLTGQGILVAVIDSGIQTGHIDLDDNLHPASKDMFAGRGTLDSEDQHGTWVAGVIAAEKNDFLTQGVAFDAQILALRTDDPGSCADVDGCTFSDSTIASAVDYAVAQGARIINISLGGPDPNLPVLNAAISAAVAAGVIIVVSAGNEGDASLGPEGSSKSYIDSVGAGQIIIAGAISESLILSTFSNPAGGDATYATAFAVAPGESIIVSQLDGDGTYSRWSVGGTSFSAPHIAAAAAILLQAFPSLTAAEVVEILLNTAVDLGAPGIDAVYGMGLIDLAAALAPSGPLSISVKTADGVQIFSLDESGIVAGPAFGDAFGPPSGFAQSVFLDGYDRAYGVDLARRTTATSSALNFEIPKPL